MTCSSLSTQLIRSEKKKPFHVDIFWSLVLIHALIPRVQQTVCTKKRTSSSAHVHIHRNKKKNNNEVKGGQSKNDEKKESDRVRESERKKKEQNENEHPPILFHQRTLPAILQIDIVRVEIPFGGYDHHLGHRPRVNMSMSMLATRAPEKHKRKKSKEGKREKKEVRYKANANKVIKRNNDRRRGRR
jgi:hypothetical protein